MHREGVLVELRVNRDNAFLVALEFADVLGDFHRLGRLSVRADVVLGFRNIDFMERADRGAEFLGTPERREFLLDRRHVVAPSMRRTAAWISQPPRGQYYQ